MEEELPEGVSTLRISPYIPRELEDEAGRPFLEYTFTGPLLLEALRRHLDEVVTPEPLQLDGVSDLWVSGGRERLLEIEFDRGAGPETRGRPEGDRPTGPRAQRRDRAGGVGRMDPDDPEPTGPGGRDPGRLPRGHGVHARTD